MPTTYCPSPKPDAIPVAGLALLGLKHVASLAVLITTLVAVIAFVAAV